MYAKIYDRIVESSLMETPIEVRYTFVFLLAIADLTGHVIGTDIAIARRLNMPLEGFRRCITELGSPDPDSNSQECEGRRVVPSEVERGYRIVNYETYRDIRDAEERRAYMREYMRKRRAAADVNSGELELAELADAEAPASAPVELKEAKKAKSSPKLSMTDEQWIESLKANPVYSGLDIDREYGKAKVWCEANRRSCSRRFFANWINHDRVMNAPKAAATNGNGVDHESQVRAWREDRRQYYSDRILAERISGCRSFWADKGEGITVERLEKWVANEPVPFSYDYEEKMKAKGLRSSQFSAPAYTSAQ